MARFANIKSSYETFSEALPECESLSDARGQKKESSQSVAKTVPPNFLVKEDKMTYIAVGTEFLTANKDQLDSVPLSTPDPNISLRTEADVYGHLRSTLVNELGRAIDMDPTHRDKLRIVAEIQLNTLCVDVSFRYKRGGTEKTLMIIKLKKAKYIETTHFRSALYRRDMLDSSLQPYVHNHNKNLRNQESGLMQLKQVTAYSKLSSYRYAALCHYVSLILFTFSSDWTKAEVVILDATGFRKALLGFLLEFVRST
ncbi:hypothetical protein E8E12_008383 [Didymella heteroderae]|uniref:Uncharacterized protein n=1 Tax=Didymella heteroderae TaxID=1769908 RepID=A0A9P4WTD5_9PLEO|nr:hypothetical protein E8E12_008383 [Didymella heteroderae]